MAVLAWDVSMLIRLTVFSTTSSNRLNAAEAPAPAKNPSFGCCAKPVAATSSERTAPMSPSRPPPI